MLTKVKVLFTVLLLAFVSPSVAQDVYTFPVLDIEQTEHGRFIDVRQNDDTLRVYTEHITRNERPDYMKAEKADVVVWCYPKKYEHESHLFPESEGRVFSMTNGNVITFFSREGAKKIGVD